MVMEVTLKIIQELKLQSLLKEILFMSLKPIKTIIIKIMSLP